MRSAVSKKAGVMPRWPEEVEGMETSKRARRRKPDTGQGGPEATIQQYSGGQGVHHVAESNRGMESEGLEEKYRAVIEGETPR